MGLPTGLRAGIALPWDWKRVAVYAWLSRMRVRHAMTSGLGPHTDSSIRAQGPCFGGRARAQARDREREKARREQEEAERRRKEIEAASAAIAVRSPAVMVSPHQAQQGVARILRAFWQEPAAQVMQYQRLLALMLHPSPSLHIGLLLRAPPSSCLPASSSHAPLPLLCASLLPFLCSRIRCLRHLPPSPASLLTPLWRGWLTSGIRSVLRANSWCKAAAAEVGQSGGFVAMWRGWVCGWGVVEWSEAGWCVCV